ncbi:MAG: hypothetical protein JWQ19_1925 [Subtercola sp.]|nr:hypothetical protein [Subtercola sp.]
MLYVDDSGSETSGLIIYGWIECTPERWRNALRGILELRKALYRDYSVPPAAELHATKFVNGRSRISTVDAAIDPTEWKPLGRAIAVDCLEFLAACTDLKVGCVFRRTPARGSEYYGQRASVYQALVTLWNDEHRAADSYAFVSMDGDGSDPSYFAAHRSLELDARHIRVIGGNVWMGLVFSRVVPG